jgi:hypothetical protein
MVSATLRNTSDAGEATIPPGGDVRREYVIQVPEGLEGQAVLSVPAIAANAVALDVRQAVGAVKAAEAAPAEPAASPAEAPKPSADKAEISAAAEFFKEHFSGYEPLYFIAGGDYPKSFRSVSSIALQQHGPFGQARFLLKGLHIAYTQTSLWDLTSPRSPSSTPATSPKCLR